MLFNRYRTLSLFLIASGIAFAPSVTTAEALRVELNKLEPQDGACRAYLVFENRTATSFSGLTLDLVMFDGEGVIARRLAVDAAPLPADKISVKLFDIDDLECANVQRILINDVLDCQDENGEVSDCVARIETRSRADAALVK
ncbi:MAG: Tat pathway signal sequence domain protein [Gammaproteobacteria bacterium]|nr:Tat pathway signal sequence domain protein [Gammaproteobacteria bacterium]